VPEQEVLDNYLLALEASSLHPFTIFSTNLYISF
jgi:hypothetical protein